MLLYNSIRGKSDGGVFTKPTRVLYLLQIMFTVGIYKRLLVI